LQDLKKIILKTHLIREISASGPLRGTAGWEVLNFQSLIRRGGVPSAAAALIMSDRSWVTTNCFYPKKIELIEPIPSIFPKS